jgi:hypothetical protein
MYFLSATLTIVFLVLFGVVDHMDLGYAWKPLPILIMSFQVIFLLLVVNWWVVLGHRRKSHFFYNDDHDVHKTNCRTPCGSATNL